MLNSLFEYNNIKNVSITGLTKELFALYINNLYKKEKKDILIVTPSMYEANIYYDLLSNSNNDVYQFLMDDFLTSEAIAISPDLMVERLETINETKTKRRKIVVANMYAYLRFLPEKKKYFNSVITLKKDEEVNYEKLVERLINIGYIRENLVTKTGEIGVRGFVLDIFPISSDHPIRIEFFGDYIESIRIFDEKTQKSIENINEIKIFPWTEFITDENVDNKHKNMSLLKEKLNNIRDYLNDPVVFFVDYNNILTSYKLMLNQVVEYKEEKDKTFKGKYFFDFSTELDDNYYYSLTNYTKSKDFINYKFDNVPYFNEDVKLINDYITNCFKKEKIVVISLPNSRVESLNKYLEHTINKTTPKKLKKQVVNVIDLNINEGFSKDNIIVLGSKNLFKVKTRPKRVRNTYKYSSKINDINKLEIDDFVVHNTHGIGIYKGIRSLKQGGYLKDFLEIWYRGNDKLYIPVEKIDLINKYSSNESVVPKIHKLGGKEWYNTKLRIKKKVESIAKELLEISAKRNMQKGFSFLEDEQLENKFNEDFIYTETKDQLKTYLEIKEDMQKDIPMDRLLCGDVGFGKTEVAFRAVFKAILSDKQVLYLCPTTILSNQQYNSAIERFENFPVNIALLNRFTTTKEKKRIIQDLKDGKIDLLIGTHRLLSNDIKPKDLGLLIIDEEQRFGVTHKEKLKKLKENVDILTLSATPIPRTLQMSLSGLKSMSLIETPPIDRYPVQTYVIEESDQIIRDAIYKELSRGGQVYFLYNRVSDIEKMANKVKSLVPEASVIFAHGQMNKNELEDRMLAFTNHEYNVLVSTTIIETGIDIANVNSLIIIDADKFGLSQLYQLRGRVGRSNKIAYAYLFYKEHKVLTETATKRLETIKKFTELGSGISVANRDLSIRGAGDILGREQAGFIDSVGVDLYLKILNDEVEKLKGNEVKEESTTENPVINVETHIPDSYVKEEQLKLEIHRLINSISTKDEIVKVKEELEDRFGKVSEELEIYMYQEYLESLIEKSLVDVIRQTKTNITIIFKEELNDKISGDIMFEKAFKLSNDVKIKFINNKIYVQVPINKFDTHFVYPLIDFLNEINELTFD